MDSKCSQGVPTEKFDCKIFCRGRTPCIRVVIVRRCQPGRRRTERARAPGRNIQVYRRGNWTVKQRVVEATVEAERAGIFRLFSDLDDTRPEGDAGAVDIGTYWPDQQPRVRAIRLAHERDRPRTFVRGQTRPAPADGVDHATVD